MREPAATRLAKPPSPAAAAAAKVDREFGVRERTTWQNVLRRFVRHKLAMTSLLLFVAIVLFAFVGPLVWKHGYADITPANAKAPSAAYPFGTDGIGHDNLAQVMRGTQQSIKISLAVAVIAAVVGALWGAAAGYFGRLTESLLMRLADMFLLIPVLAIAAALGSVSGGTWYMVSIIIGGLAAAYVSRVVRGVVLSLREQEFIEAALALGASNMRVIFRHLLPNALGPLIVNATVLVATGILTETALSYLGFGVQPPDISLGLLISNSEGEVRTKPWLFYFPGIFIILIALSVNFIGDGLRDALDPRQTRVRK